MTRASEVDCSSLEKRTIPILRLCLPKISNKSLEIGWFTWLWKDQLLFCGLQPHDWELILGKKWSSRYVWETVEERQCLNLVSLTQSCEKGKVVGFMKYLAGSWMWWRGEWQYEVLSYLKMLLLKEDMLVNSGKFSRLPFLLFNCTGKSSEHFQVWGVGSNHIFVLWEVTTFWLLQGELLALFNAVSCA